MIPEEFIDEEYRHMRENGEFTDWEPSWRLQLAHELKAQRLAKQRLKKYTLPTVAEENGVLLCITHTATKTKIARSVYPQIWAMTFALWKLVHSLC